jgi:hypothetical protein
VRDQRARMCPRLVTLVATMGTDETDLPKLGAPARRALLGAGYTRLEHLTEVTESEVMRLHGMGPTAMTVLRDALAERGLFFRDG